MSTDDQTPSTLTRVLLIEDDQIDERVMLRRVREGLPGATEFTVARSLRESLHYLKAQPFEIVFVDLSLPDSAGLPTLDQVLEACESSAVVVLTGSYDEQLALEAIRRGAQDYLVKSQVSTEWIVHSMRQAIERQRLHHGELQKRDREMQMRDRLLSHVSHELRTPLTAICYFATILSDEIEGQLNDSQQDFVDVIQRNGTQLARMISDLMDVSSIQSGKMQYENDTFSLTDTAEAAVKSIRPLVEDRDQTLEVDLSEAGACTVLGDAARIEQVLHNLLSNAAKFTPKQGRVSIQLRRNGASHNREFGFASIVIEDDGPGIPAGQETALFERLVQGSGRGETARKGLGLGLYLCREIVLAHSGRIWATNRPDGGARFELEIPLYSLELLVSDLLERSPDAKEMALIQVDLTLNQSSPCAQDTTIHAARQLLGDSTLAMTDRLLPITHQSHDRARLFAIASCGETGGGAIAERAAAALRRLQSESSTEDFGFEVGTQIFSIPARTSAAVLSRQIEEHLTPLTTEAQTQ